MERKREKKKEEESWNDREYSKLFRRDEVTKKVETSGLERERRSSAGE